MAKFTDNPNKLKKSIDKIQSKLLQYSSPIILPRNKIDAANYKTSLALKQVKNLKIILAIETIILIMMCIIAIVEVIN